MSREALVLLVCCCDFRDGAERLISSKSLRNAVIRAFPGLFRILRMCAPRRAAAVVRPRGREKSADRRRRILISRLLIIRASVPRRKSPFPAYFKGFPAVSPLIPPYPAFLKYPVSPQLVSVAERITALAEPERLNEGGYLSGLVSECLDIQATKEVCPNIPLLISGSYREDVRNAEYAILTHYCSANNCTMSELAKKLGISRATLYNRLRVQGKSEIT